MMPTYFDRLPMLRSNDDRYWIRLLSLAAKTLVAKAPDDDSSREGRNGSYTDM
jgi:hypothetical protein